MINVLKILTKNYHFNKTLEPDALLMSQLFRDLQQQKIS